MSFVDLHSHVTWNVDDGIENKEDSYTALKMAKQDGIEHLVLTPHYIPGRFKKEDHDEITEVMDECIQYAKGLGIHAYKGCELFLNEDYLDMLDQHLFHSINDTKYLLVEFDVRKDLNENDSAEDKLFEISIKGYVPVIAHVERYFYQKIDLKRIAEWVDMGYVIQVNRTSLLGMNGNSVKQNARKLIESNLVHVVSTDTHRIHGSRIAKMSDVYEYLKKEYGKDNADLLCYVNGMNILQGKEVDETDISIKESRFSKLFRRR